MTKLSYNLHFILLWNLPSSQPLRVLNNKIINSFEEVMSRCFGYKCIHYISLLVLILIKYQILLLSLNFLFKNKQDSHIP